MTQINLNDYNHVYFVGIGGISMSGLAEILLARGIKVQGSDQTLSQITQHLELSGIHVNNNHDGKNISDDIDLVVYTAAVKADNPELLAAKEKNITIIERSVLLGTIMHDYNNSVGVAGTHGKTTTTSMLSYIMMEAELDPTISVGAMLKSIDSNFRIGNSEYFLLEACEYSNSYHEFFPNIGIILNIEEDHLDFFENLAAIRQSFRGYMENIKDGGTLFIHSDIDNIDQLTKGLTCNIKTFGPSPSANYTYSDLTYNDKGCSSFTLVEDGKALTDIKLSVIGEHNVHNALSAIGAALSLGIPMDYIKNGLLKFTGASRRFEYLGSFNGTSVIDDYAHHPTEIKATLDAIGHIDFNNLYIVFQPHTYSRLIELYDEFVEVFKGVPNIIVTDIYAAREKNPGNISSLGFVKSMKSFNPDIVHIADFEEICGYLRKKCSTNDMLITLGAGNVNKIGYSLISE